MSAAIKMFSGKCIHIKSALASETPFSFLISVYYNGRKFNSLNGKRIVHQSLCITSLYIKLNQVAFGNSYECAVVFVINFHSVHQYMSDEPESVFQEIVINSFVNFGMIEPEIFQESNHSMH